jgi:hypothetical protein
MVWLQTKIWLWVPEGARHQDGLTDWPSLWLWRSQKSQRINLSNLQTQNPGRLHTALQLLAVWPHLGPLQAAPKMCPSATKNALCHPTGVLQLWITASQQLPTVYCAKKELQWRKLYLVGPRAPSGHHFTSKTVSPGKFYATAATSCVLETHPADTQPSKRPINALTKIW